MTEKIKRDIRDVEDFTKIELRCWGHINLTQGDVCQLVVEAESELLDHLEISVENSILIIEFDEEFNKQNHWHEIFKGKNYKDHAIEYNITLPKLESIKIMGKGSLTADELTGEKLMLSTPGVSNVEIKSLKYERVAIEILGVTSTNIAELTADAVALSIKGTGKISIADLQTESLVASIKGSGTIQVSGRTKNQSITVPGVGNYNAERLETDVAQLISNGMTNSTLWVNDALDVTLRGMGNVNYYGNPTVKKQIHGMGRIKRAGETPKVIV